MIKLRARPRHAGPRAAELSQRRRETSHAGAAAALIDSDVVPLDPFAAPRVLDAPRALPSGSGPGARLLQTTGWVSGLLAVELTIGALLRALRGADAWELGAILSPALVFGATGVAILSRARAARWPVVVIGSLAAAGGAGLALWFSPFLWGWLRDREGGLRPAVVVGVVALTTLAIAGAAVAWAAAGPDRSWFGVPGAAPPGSSRVGARIGLVAVVVFGALTSLVLMASLTVP